jgi:hypothetical protein
LTGDLIRGIVPGGVEMADAGTVWVELVGDLVLARVRGTPSEALLRDLQDRVSRILRDTGPRSVLYDALEMEAPSTDMVFDIIAPTRAVAQTAGRMAIVVPNSRLAYLARMAFGDGDYRVFYNDMAAAVLWLNTPAGQTP